MATYGYANVCKNFTDSVSDTIAEQKKNLIKIGNRNSKIKRSDDIYVDSLDTGDGNHGQTELKVLLNKVQAGDTIIVTDLNYLCHSAKDFAYIVEKIAEKKARLLIGGWNGVKAEEMDFRPNKGSDTDAIRGQGMVYMASLFSRIESAKIKRGMIKASADGKTVGRPKTTAQTLPEQFLTNYPKFKKGEITKSDFARLVGVSRPTLYAYLEIAQSADI